LVRASETDVVVSHEALISRMSAWVREDAALLASTDAAGYDLDAYCLRLERATQAKIASLNALKAKVQGLRKAGGRGHNAM
jgi:hypothetical protein